MGAPAAQARPSGGTPPGKRAARQGCRALQTAAMYGGPTSSAQAADRSLPRKRESSFPSLGPLSPRRPLRWVAVGSPIERADNIRPYRPGG